MDIKYEFLPFTLLPGGGIVRTFKRFVAETLSPRVDSLQSFMLGYQLNAGLEIGFWSA